jgi:hypothetical protein
MGKSPLKAFFKQNLNITSYSIIFLQVSEETTGTAPPLNSAPGESH